MLPLVSLAAGAIGVEALASVLSDIFTLVQEIQDAQQACTRAYERLADILDELRRTPQLPAQAKLAKYDDLLRTYRASLEKYRAKLFVLRHVSYTGLMDEIKTLHEEIDTLVMKLLQPAVDNSASELNEVRDLRAQVEALTTLKYEFDHHHAERTDEMMRLMKTLCKQLVRVSRVEVPSIPQWFIPSSDVDYDVSPFAQGSFGSAHHGRWISGARVVVKTLLVDDLATATSGPRSAKERILAEIDVWFKLHHPNVIKMFGACHVSSPPFIVCELAPHGNVADFLVKSPEHHKRMWRLLYEAALGLEYLHNSQVIHGDLKLNNILVGSDGSARLADFGPSTVRSTSASSTASITRPSGSVQTAGALRWRAPECLKGKPKFESDIYSLGMCIIEAATGEPPFATVADNIVFQLLRHGEIPDQPEGLNDDAWAFVTAMTKAKPNERCKVEFVISTLKRFAGGTVDADKESLSSQDSFMSSSRSSSAITVSTSSSASRSSLDSGIRDFQRMTIAQDAARAQLRAQLTARGVNALQWRPNGDGVEPRVVVMQGDLTAIATDAIVNAADSLLSHDGGLAGAIVQRDGQIILDESRAWIHKHKWLPVSSTMVTSSGALPCRYVIHTVGPCPGGDGSKRPTPDQAQELRSAVWNSLSTAEQLGLTTIAIPGISTGIFGYPRDLAGREMLSEVLMARRSSRAVPRPYKTLQRDVLGASFTISTGGRNADRVVELLKPSNLHFVSKREVKRQGDGVLCRPDHDIVAVF